MMIMNSWIIFFAGFQKSIILLYTGGFQTTIGQVIQVLDIQAMDQQASYTAMEVLMAEILHHFGMYRFK